MFVPGHLWSYHENVIFILDNLSGNVADPRMFWPEAPGQSSLTLPSAPLHHLPSAIQRTWYWLLRLCAFYRTTGHSIQMGLYMNLSCGCCACNFLIKIEITWKEQAHLPAKIIELFVLVIQDEVNNESNLNVNRSHTQKFITIGLLDLLDNFTVMFRSHRTFVLNASF